MSELENRVRLHVYERFVADERPPTSTETAAALGEEETAVTEALRRLEEAHVLVLAPGSDEVWMANPLSAVPTAFRVEARGRSYYGNCIWDAFGILAMLDADGGVETTCADCGGELRFTVASGAVDPADAVAHFAVPAARWWDNIAFT